MLGWEIIKSDNSNVILHLWNNKKGIQNKSLTWERMAGSWEIVWCLRLHMYTLLMRSMLLFKPYNRCGWSHEEHPSFHLVTPTGLAMAQVSKQLGHLKLKSGLWLNGSHNIISLTRNSSGVGKSDLPSSLLIITSCANQTSSVDLVSKKSSFQQICRKWRARL